MSANPICVDELEHTSLFADDIASALFAEYRRVDVHRPSIRAVANAEVREDLVVEVVLTAQQLVDQREKGARLRALNDAMIIGAGHGHHLADADAREYLRRHRLVLGRISNRAGRDDYALPGHQSSDLKRSCRSCRGW